MTQHQFDLALNKFFRDLQRATLAEVRKTWRDEHGMIFVRTYTVSAHFRVPKPRAAHAHLKQLEAHPPRPVKTAPAVTVKAPTTMEIRRRRFEKRLLAAATLRRRKPKTLSKETEHVLKALGAEGEKFLAAIHTQAKAAMRKPAKA
jgi:hypothetical protein